LKKNFYVILQFLLDLQFETDHSCHHLVVVVLKSSSKQLLLIEPLPQVIPKRVALAPLFLLPLAEVSLPPLPITLLPLDEVSLPLLTDCLVIP
jgi:hypothetical protein